MCYHHVMNGIQFGWISILYSACKMNELQTITIVLWCINETNRIRAIFFRNRNKSTRTRPVEEKINTNQSNIRIEKYWRSGNKCVREKQTRSGKQLTHTQNTIEQNSYYLTTTTNKTQGKKLALEMFNAFFLVHWQNSVCVFFLWASTDSSIFVWRTSIRFFSLLSFFFVLFCGSTPLGLPGKFCLMCVSLKCYFLLSAVFLHVC